MTINLNGKNVLVTGGASGIGLACARLLTVCGAKLAIADKNQEVTQRVAAELGVLAVAMDVGQERSVEQAAVEVEARLGTVDVLVNCAGVLQRTLPPGELALSEWDIVARIDLRGTYLCCARFGTRMAERGCGVIVNIASVAGMRSGPLYSYGPAKAGVISLTECLAGEWGPKGIRVNCVSPGFTQTPALDRGFATRTLEAGALARSAALGRLVDADEIARAVTFLASDWASAITGINLPVDAGHLVTGSWGCYGGLR